MANEQEEETISGESFLAKVRLEKSSSPKLTISVMASGKLKDKKSLIEDVVAGLDDCFEALAKKGYN